MINMIKKTATVLIILALTGCSTVSFTTSAIKYDEKGNIIKKTDTKYDKTGWPDKWSPKDIDFEYHNL